MLVLIFLLGEIREPWPPLWVMESAARVLLGGWLFALGASVGSFLNVVIYRLPRGMSLAHPGSHCPNCGHAIRGRDNIPLASWLLLGGKCRDCKTPISPRYYYVELIVGLTFLLVAVFEAFLPRQTWLGSDIIRRPLHWQETLPFWSAYATHVVLLTTLLGAALIDRDGWRPPWRMFVPAMLLALVSGALWPPVRPIAAFAGLAGPAWQVGLTDAVAGLAAGAACSVLFGRLPPRCWRCSSSGCGSHAVAASWPWPASSPFYRHGSRSSGLAF
jgi:leader peptidase (prepilin peptidase)/N-methyltransferase